jgi:DNA primase
MSQVQEVKQANDIIQVIGERVTLQRSGANWRGLCPFHSEKSPSFFVSEQLQRYRCFGCSESGDIFTFLEKYDGMTFAESLQYLADKAGITLTQQSFSSEDDQRKRVLEILNLAKEYYHFLLTKHEVGKKGREYLAQRGTTAESIKVFQLGYALASWDGLLKYLRDKKKYALANIEASGLIVQGKGGRYYDRFRDRLIFPLTDHRGRVVGFSGRVFEKSAKEAKYINSPETLVYHKSQMLFGFSQLYQSIRQANEVVVAEGEFDVISSAQAHVNNVVAVKGSALTEEQMKLLSRTVGKVILSFDMDSAGVTATKRAIEVARPFGLELRVIALPNEFKTKDPDELAHAHPDVWRQAVKSSISVWEFFLQAALKSFSTKTPEGKRQIIDELAPIFGQISHAVELEYYVKKLSEALDVKTTIVQSDLRKFQQVKKKGLSPTKNSDSNLPQKLPTKLSRRDRLEAYLLFLLFNMPENEMIEHATQLQTAAVSYAGSKQIIVALLQNAQPTLHFASFAKTLADDLQQSLLDFSTNPEYFSLLPTMDLQKEWQKGIAELKKLQVSDDTQKLNQRLEELERERERTPDQDQEYEQILRQIVQLRAH